MLNLLVKQPVPSDGVIEEAAVWSSGDMYFIHCNAGAKTFVTKSRTAGAIARIWGNELDTTPLHP